MSKVVDLFDPDTGDALENVPVAEPKVNVDYSRYFEFVNEVTSDASRYTDSFISRIGELEDEGVDIQRLLTAAVGISAEGGEFTEIVKKVCFQGKPYNESNREHMIVELGDVMWYIAQACMALGVSLDDIVIRNVNKLSARYPEGTFEVFRSENRREGDI